MDLPGGGHGIGLKPAWGRWWGGEYCRLRLWYVCVRVCILAAVSFWWGSKQLLWCYYVLHIIILLYYYILHIMILLHSPYYYIITFSI